MALANEIWRPSGESWPREGCRLSLPRTLTGQAAIWSSGVAAKSAIQIEAWERAWESLDTPRYAKFYSEDFRTETKSLRTWLQHKTRVNAAKQFIDIDLNGLSILGYPGEDDLVVASFTQDYRSSNFSSLADKRQYWKRELDGAWRIVYEGTVKIRPEHVRGSPTRRAQV